MAIFVGEKGTGISARRIKGGEGGKGLEIVYGNE